MIELDYLSRLKSFLNQNLDLEIFDKAKDRLSNKVLHFGYVDAREDYCSWLKRCDIVVSTSLHEFFGISVVEAVRAGCRPLLPNRLSYPELFTEEFLYDNDEFKMRLKETLQNCKPKPCSPTNEVSNSWPQSHLNADGSTRADAEDCALKAFLQREQ